MFIGNNYFSVVFTREAVKTASSKVSETWDIFSFLWIF